MFKNTFEGRLTILKDGPTCGREPDVEDFRYEVTVKAEQLDPRGFVIDVWEAKRQIEEDWHKKTAYDSCEVIATKICRAVRSMESDRLKYVCVTIDLGTASLSYEVEC